MELGVRLAVAPGRSGGRAGSGPAIVGAVLGVLGIVGAMTFRAGIDDVVAHDARAGTTWNRVVNLPFEVEVPSLTGVAGVRAAAEVQRGEVAIGGQTMSAWSYESKAGDRAAGADRRAAAVGARRSHVGLEHGAIAPRRGR